jgi:Tfp pilus assembly protein PilP
VTTIKDGMVVLRECLKEGKAEHSQRPTQSLDILKSVKLKAV